MSLVLLIAGLVGTIALMVWLLKSFRAPELPAPAVKPSSVPDFGPDMSWLAVRTRDTADLVSALQLEPTEAVNWAHGLAAIHDVAAADRTIFVSPPIGEWSLVAGQALPHPLGAMFHDKCTPTLNRLSRRYGVAHYYSTFPMLDFFAWAKAERGRIVRAHASSDEGVIWNTGPLSPEERDMNMRFIELRGIDNRHGDVGGDLLLVPTQDHVLKLAAAWSCDPKAVRPRAEADTVASGLLAKTPTAWRSQLIRKKAA